jgi:hypothetical protein
VSVASRRRSVDDRTKRSLEKLSVPIVNIFKNITNIFIAAGAW